MKKKYGYDFLVFIIFITALLTLLLFYAVIPVLASGDRSITAKYGLSIFPMSLWLIMLLCALVYPLFLKRKPNFIKYYLTYIPFFVFIWFSFLSMTTLKKSEFILKKNIPHDLMVEKLILDDDALEGKSLLLNSFDFVNSKRGTKCTANISVGNDRKLLDVNNPLVIGDSIFYLKKWDSYISYVTYYVNNKMIRGGRNGVVERNFNDCNIRIYPEDFSDEDNCIYVYEIWSHSDNTLKNGKFSKNSPFIENSMRIKVIEDKVSHDVTIKAVAKKYTVAAFVTVIITLISIFFALLEYINRKRGGKWK